MGIGCVIKIKEEGGKEGSVQLGISFLLANTSRRCSHKKMLKKNQQTKRSKAKHLVELSQKRLILILSENAVVRQVVGISFLTAAAAAAAAAAGRAGGFNA